MNLGHVEPLFPVLWRHGLVEWNAIHHGDVSALVPVDAGLLVLDGQRLLIDFVVLHQLEESLVASKAHGSQLVVVPELLVHVLDVRVVVSTVDLLVDHGARLTDEGAQPDDCMGRLVLLAVDAVLIVRVGEFLLEEFLELLGLLKGSSGDEGDNGLLARLLILLNVDDDFLVVLDESFGLDFFLYGILRCVHFTESKVFIIIFRMSCNFNQLS